jgi:hypothetical protein
MAEPRHYEKLKRALGPAADCPPLEQLVRALEASEGEPWRKAAEDHAANCAHCRDELALMHEFVDASPLPDETRNVNWIAHRLEKQRVFRPSQKPFSFLFGMRAWATAACLLMVAAGAFYLPRGPGDPSSTGTGEGVMRSQTLELVGPVGDILQKPAGFHWRAVPGGVRYQVRLMEVDRREVWRAEATDDFVSMPAPVLSLMAPGRTLLWEVSAWDKNGKALGTSATQSFRVSR